MALLEIDDQVTSFRNAVKAEGGVTLIDERKSAAPCFHLSF